MQSIQFFTAGIPAPKGSHRALMLPGRPYPTVFADNPKSAKIWARAVSAAARTNAALNHWQVPQDSPLRVDLTFTFPRPKGHFRIGKYASLLKPSAPPFMLTKPDVDKLTRLVLDALTGILWSDDSQVQTILASKFYATNGNSGVEITVEERGDE